MLFYKQNRKVFMKKIIKLILVIFTAIMLTGCGKDYNILSIMNILNQKMGMLYQIKHLIMITILQDIQKQEMVMFKYSLLNIKKQKMLKKKQRIYIRIKKTINSKKKITILM